MVQAMRLQQRCGLLLHSRLLQQCNRWLRGDLLWRRDLKVLSRLLQCRLDFSAWLNGTHPLPWRDWSPFIHCIRLLNIGSQY